ncbi:CRISPR-associated endonuclease Cas1 [Methanosphaerula palustris]|uniref:CRISPR-associated endonuclease Cas1 n=1 Tax=Methanosphaerula palustris TaxID=475088 RepID=UPI00032318A6|nr:CRISPR-associated endonuclease Cas1 [Methanosphaerula palustris]
MSGYGAHIKSTPRLLIVQKNGTTTEYPIGDVHHLLVVGGHTIHSAVLQHMQNAGNWVSFFAADGTPVGLIRPPEDRVDEQVRAIQRHAPAHSYALGITRAALGRRLQVIGETTVVTGESPLYQGELEVLQDARQELEYLVTLDEIRRLHRLATDMYYEIMARTIPKGTGFRRRTARPYMDPVNTMLSFSYGILSGVCAVHLAGAHLDANIGLLHQGERALVRDLTELFKPQMVDQPIFALVRQGITASDYEIGESRCTLSDALIRRMLLHLQTSIEVTAIGRQVEMLADALIRNREFQILDPAEFLPRIPLKNH